MGWPPPVFSSLPTCGERLKHVALRSHDGSGLVAALIANGTYDEVNHSSFEFVEDGLVLEALMRQGVVIRPVKESGAGDVVHRFVFAVTDEQYAAALAAAHNEKGKPYDKAAVVRFVPLLRRLVKEDREASGRRICSEVVEVLARVAGIPFVATALPVEHVSPRDQFRSIRCDRSVEFGPVAYERIEKGLARAFWVRPLSTAA